MAAGGPLIICDGETCPAGVELVADEGEGNVHTKTGGLKLEMGVNRIPLDVGLVDRQWVCGTEWIVELVDFGFITDSTKSCDSTQHDALNIFKTFM